ncbi:hypothetical protein [Thermodesulfobacterium hveragerdense]|uniref:hypothetical protein n=1 Tax=Thermodesulfobacterium hveragerdense TaxID=53424 RepID=UPI00041F4F31|nr:hypothetical protein [Thermodesulfobacterium hveragerdense]
MFFRFCVKFLFVLMWILTAFIPSFAEEKETKLEEIVVTATRTEKEVEIASASVNVIKKQNMEKRNIKTLDDVINKLPGVYVHRTRLVLDIPTDANSLRGIPGYG